jgi:Cu2+-exporting ATPase
MLIELAILSGSATYWLMSRQKHVQTSGKRKQKSAVSSTQKLLKDVKSALLGDERQKQQSLIRGDENADLQKMDRLLNYNWLIAAGTLGAVLLSPLNLVWAVLARVGILYLSFPLFLFAWKNTQAGYVINVFTVDSILVVGMLLTGQLTFAVSMSVLASLKYKLIVHTEDNLKKQLINVFVGHPVWLLKEGVEIQVDFESVQAGDIVIVNAGEIIPVDGVIQSGLASIVQHLLTGESQPAEKGPGEQVFAATLLLSGRIAIDVQTAGNETVAAQIGEVLNKTQHYKDSLMLRGQKIANQLAPVTFGIGGFTWATLGATPALSVLWAGFGLNMIALGPLTVLSYLQILSRHGVLIKDGRVLETLRQVDTIVFDKTGTLTLEQPTVGQIHSLGDYDDETVLRYAAVAEYRQPHPIAKAILAKAEAAELKVPEPDEAGYEVGYGIKVNIDEHTIRVGSARFMQREDIVLPNSIAEIQARAQEYSFSLIYVSVDQELAGILEMQPSIRPEAKQVVEILKQRGIGLYIISGDHEQPPRNMAESLGIDHYFAETLPENKADLVKQLSDEGKFVCFIGDGINDAIALKSAQVSISLKGASTAATDTAQIIFMDGTLNQIKSLFELADEFESTMHTNLLTSIVPGVIGIGGVYFLRFGIAASMTTYYIGSLIGLGNSLWPLIKHQETEQHGGQVLAMD